ncbi:MAG: PAS domain-containing protein [Promethearchaeota archaeon]
MGSNEESSKSKTSCAKTDLLFHDRFELGSSSSQIILSALLELIDRPAFVVDVTDFTIISMNALAEKEIVTANPCCYLSAHGLDGHRSPKDSSPVVNQVLRNRKSMAFQHAHTPKGGGSCRHQIRGIPIPDSRGRIAYVIEVWGSPDEYDDSVSAINNSDISSKIGIHMYEATEDDNLIFLGANPAADQILGIDNSQFIGKSIQDAFPALTETEVPQRYLEVALFGTTWSTEQIEYDAGDISGAFEVHAIQTSPRRMIAAFIDITLRKQADEELRRSERRHRTIMESMHDLVFVYDSQNRYSEYYASSENIFYKSPKEFIGKHVNDILPIEAATKYLMASVEVRRDGSPVTIEYPLPFGDTIRWYSKTLTLHEDGQSIVAVVRDITQGKMAEARLLEQRDFLERVIESMTHPFYVIDANDYAIKMANQAANLGHPDSLTKCYKMSHKRDLPCSGEDHPCPLDIIKKSKQPTVVEHCHYDLNGDIRYVEVHAYPVFDANGEVVQMIEYALDVTDQKLAEKQLALETRRARLYLDLLGHDMANELQVIQGSVELLKEINQKEIDCIPSERFLDQIIDSVQRCNRMIMSARATEKLAIAPLVDRSLSRVISQCIDVQLETYEDVEITVKNSCNSDVVLADKFLEDLFSNIIQNAVEHNKSACRRVWISLHDTSDGFEISVADNGPGIADNLKQYLFDPFQRLGGVGLHFSFEIVQKYGGSIRIRDRVPGNFEEGANFVIWLPKPGGSYY